jgi:biopolymer transport protein ExbD/biopolymer transport protein TolR
MAIDIGSKQTKPGRATPNMNVTPLVDVVLVLLIIFMVITPLLAKQFWLNLPNKPDKEPQQEVLDDKNAPIVVTVTKAGEIKINRDVVPEAQFAAKLKRVLAGSGQRTVFFDAEDDAEFGKAVAAMDLARAGGAATIVVLTDAIASAK